MMTWLISSAYSALESIGYRPRELYTFARGDQVWRMTGGTSLLTIFGRPGLSYQPALITRDRIERSDESRSSSVTVRVARTTPVADALREVRASPMTLRLERWQDKDADHPAPVVIIPAGEIANVRLVGGWVEFEVLNGLTGDAVFDLPFPSRLISRQNQWPTFSEFTAVNEEDFSFETTITAITRSPSPSPRKRPIPRTAITTAA
jgi:hypothetical protein